MSAIIGRVSVSITHPTPFSRQVHVVAPRPIDELRFTGPLPEVMSLQDVANQFEFLLRQCKSLTKNT